MSRPPEVFVSQAINADFSPAEKEFGQVRVLTFAEIWPYGNTTSNMHNVQAIERAIALDYRPGVDYLLPTGSVLAMAHMLAAAVEKGTTHQILKWDARAQRYYCYKLTTPRGRHRGESE